MSVRKNKKDFSDSCRRQHPRLKLSAVPMLKSVVLNQGTEAKVINISRGGILLETEVRLRPQMKIFLKLVTSDGLVRLEGRIIRSSISSLKGTPRFQSAIAFDHPFHMLDDLSSEKTEQAEESLPESEAPLIIDNPGEQPPMQDALGNALDDESAILTVITQDGTSLQDMFELNDW